MIKLKDILNENITPQYLYHFTIKPFFEQILESDTLKENDGDISFTDDENLWQFKELPEIGEEISVRLKFNFRDILNYSGTTDLSPFVYSEPIPGGQELEHEKEWRYIGSDIEGIRNLLVSVSSLDYVKDDVMAICQKYGIKYDD